MTLTQEHQPTHRLVPRKPAYPSDDEIDILDQTAEPIPPAEPPPPPPPKPRKPTIDELFNGFHSSHPEVYEEFVRLARVAKQNGHQRISIKMLAEIVRFRFVIDREYDAEVDKTYLFNNVLTSRYSRLIMRQEPDLDGIFRTRKLTSK